MLWREVLGARRSKYPEQFRRDAIELVNSSDRSWVNVAKQAAEAGPPVEDPAVTDEVARVRKQVAELEKEK